MQHFFIAKVANIKIIHGMSLIEILLLAAALSMDAFAVSIAFGVAKKRADVRGALSLGLAFGIFQALMPITGFYLSNFAYSYIASIDHWIAFGLLAFIGGKMVVESRSEDEENSTFSNFNFLTLIILAVATSIDALAVGISFACLQEKIWFPSIVIGVVTFAFSFFGVLFGSRLGAKFGAKAELVGGIVLILIGVRILFCG